MATGCRPSTASDTGAMTAACFYAFDLIELNGDDLRTDPLEIRKATLVQTNSCFPHGSKSAR
jgi:ATP-dependent DNA ligase